MLEELAPPGAGGVSVNVAERILADDPVWIAAVLVDGVVYAAVNALHGRAGAEEHVRRHLALGMGDVQLCNVECRADRPTGPPLPASC